MQNEEESSPASPNVVGNDLEYSWDRLPCCVLEKIYSHLNPVDRAIASVVCRTWQEAYNCPDLWRQVTIKCPIGKKGSCNFQKRIAQRFGDYFQDLAIICFRGLRKNKKWAYRDMSDFFHIMELKGVQVQSFRMSRLEVLTKFDKRSQAVITEPFINFLKMQTGLTKVDFTHGRTHTASCLDILENLVAENVQHLKLQKFFSNHKEIIPPMPRGRRRRMDDKIRQWSERYLTDISRFRNLRSLSVNYSYLADEVVDNLAVSLEGHLELLSLLWDSWTSVLGLSDRIVCDESWNALITKCPRMKVHFRLEPGNFRINAIIEYNFMSRQWPLESFELVMNRRWSPEDDHEIFNYLPECYAATLRNLEFTLKGFDDQDVRAGLVHLLSNCPLLESLTWRIQFDDSRLEVLLLNIFEILQQHNKNNGGTISLKTFRVKLRERNPNNRRFSNFSVRETFVPLFNVFGVHLIIRSRQ